MDNELHPGDKIKHIPFDALIDIQISGAFYADLQQQLFILLQQKESEGAEKVNKRLKELETEQPKDFWEFQVTTLLAILYATENAAKKQGHIVATEALDYLPKEDSTEGASPES